METFDFPYHQWSVEYPESGFRMEFGNSYVYTAGPSSPDQRKLTLYFSTMKAFPATVYRQSAVPRNPEEGSVWFDLGSKNLLTWSESLTNFAAIDIGVDIAGNKLSESNTSVIPHYIQASANYSGGVGAYVFSATVKADERSGVILQALSASDTHEAWFDVDTLSISNISSGDTAEIIPLGDDKFRCVLRIANMSSIVSPVQRVFIWDTTQNSTDYAGSVGSGIYIYNLQLENSSDVGAYIKTLGAPVSTVGRKKVYRADQNGYWVASSSDSALNLTRDPQINIAALDDFYSRHKLYKRFWYDHPMFGMMQVRFNKPLMIPKGYADGDGTLEPFELEFLEAP